MKGASKGGAGGRKEEEARASLVKAEVIQAEWYHPVTRAGSMLVTNMGILHLWSQPHKIEY